MIKGDIKPTELPIKTKKHVLIFGKMSIILSILGLIPQYLFLVLIPQYIIFGREITLSFYGLIIFLMIFIPVLSIISGIISLVKKTPKNLFPIIGIVFSFTELIVPLLFFAMIILGLVTVLMPGLNPQHPL